MSWDIDELRRWSCESCDASGLIIKLEELRAGKVKFCMSCFSELKWAQ